MKPKYRVVIALCLAAALAYACFSLGGPPQAGQEKKPTKQEKKPTKEKLVSVNLSGIDLGKREAPNVAWFSVEDDRGGGMSFVPGGTTCCVDVPETWHPGIKFKVRWGYPPTTQVPHRQATWKWKYPSTATRTWGA